jgi:hypothetical protein
MRAFIALEFAANLACFGASGKTQKANVTAAGNPQAAF